MTREKALRIQYLRTGPVMHSWRRISEIICEEFPEDTNQELKGNQMHGKWDLCWEAMILLAGVTDIKDVPEKMREEWDT